MSSARRTIVTRIARAAVLGAATIGLTLGLGSAPASAATNSPTLSITGIGGGQCQVLVAGVFQMDQYSAHGYINNLGNGGMRYNLWGWDPSDSNDALWTTLYSGASLPGTHAGSDLYAGPQGIHYHRRFQLPCYALNEDTGWLSGPRDEIFVQARFVDGDGGVREQFSDFVFGYF